MGYTTIRTLEKNNKFCEGSLEAASLAFIRERCRDLRFDSRITEKEMPEQKIFMGTSLKKGQIPYNMQMDIERLCLEKALERFLESGKKEDAFDVYFCYLEMFVGEYEKTRRMIELLSEFEANGSELLMKHRDHYVHSVYVFALGLAIYESNAVYRSVYQDYYKLTDEYQAATHYLEYWGLASLFHDIGYPFELPFEQVASYFELDGGRRENRPFVAYHVLESLITFGEREKRLLKEVYTSESFETINDLFAHLLTDKFGEVYRITKEEMRECLTNRPSKPEQFNYFMDHAYFSAIILFKKLFVEIGCELNAEHLDALTAILMHNSLYKFDIAKIRSADNIPFKPQLHPLAYMLMLCDELQCWDRIAYGRNSKKELHPMGCEFELSTDGIKATYLFDEKELTKVNIFKEEHTEWMADRQGKEPGLKAFSGMYLKNENGISKFLQDIERIVDLTTITLSVDTKLEPNKKRDKKKYLSGSNFINLYNFAVVLNGRWNNDSWKKAKEAGRIEEFLKDESVIKDFAEAFKGLSLEYKLSNINQAKAFAGYMNAIGCFYTDKEVDFELLEHFSENDILTIGPLEHQRWLQEHYDMGWVYGTPDVGERELLRQHKDMIPGKDGVVKVSYEDAKTNYDRLEKAVQDKDTDPMECMLSMLKMFDGLRIYRL